MSKYVMKMGDIAYEMDVGPPSFDIRVERDIRGRPTLIISWTRDTQFLNFIHMRMITIHLGRPWFTHISCFTDLA